MFFLLCKAEYYEGSVLVEKCLAGAFAREAAELLWFYRLQIKLLDSSDKRVITSAAASRSAFRLYSLYKT